MIRNNELSFVDSYNSPTGPFKFMSKEAIEKVHFEIDDKMQELEDTGLTRNEILFEEMVGMPLADDPFFQMIKNSRTAREMLLRPGDEFTCDRIVELALRQDVGPDASISMNREDYRFRDPGSN